MHDYLLDSFYKKGKSLDEYERIAKEIDDNTSLVPLQFKNANFLHFLRIDNNNLKYKVICPGDIFSIGNNDTYALTKNATLPKRIIQQFGTEFYNEIINNNKTIVSFNGGENKAYYFIGETTYKTLGSKLSGINGKFLKTSTLERDIALASILQDENFACHALVRTVCNCKKIFAIYTERYKRVPLQLLSDIVKEYPLESKIKYWSIDQKKTEIYLEFPKVIDEISCDMIPGILLTNSDTAYSQTAVKLVWRHKDCSSESYFIQDELCIKHSTEIKLDDIISLISQGIKMQKEFHQKYMKKRDNYEALTINNKKSFKEISTMIYKQADTQKSLGIKGQKSLDKWIEDKFGDNQIKNAADILDNIIRIMDQVDLSNNQKECYREVLSNLVA